MTTTRHSWRRRAVGVALTAAGMLLASVLVSPAAHAHDGSITCLFGTAHQEFHPPLTPTSHTTSVHEVGQLSGCISLNHPDIVAGTFTYQGTGYLNCLVGPGELEGASQGTFTFHWKDAQGHPEGTTKVELGTIAVALRPDGQNVGVATGVTTGGTHMHPGLMVYDELLLTNPLDCPLTGVSEQDGILLGLTIT
jgi:hypothetical protein